jgi:nanoRNase/pAp phosphatase (c-di-AMP/oligoRNAs hydrolase)
MVKEKIGTIKEKNTILANVIEAITKRHNFLLLGHASPDDDCIASTISFALILHMFYKNAMVYLEKQTHERFRYLLDICRYNAIRVLSPDSAPPSKVDTIVLCDTPKPSMIEGNDLLSRIHLDPEPLRIEIDHHLGADSEYFGDEGYRLVTEASSSSELVGHILLKLKERKDLLETYQISELFPRNLVLAILTGIIGDSNMGQFLKSPRERRYYRIFSTMFNEMLSQSTIKKTNFFTMSEVYGELQKLSTLEENCFNSMMGHKRFSPSIGYVALSEKTSAALYAAFDDDTIVSTARVVADRLAEESARLSLVAFYDNKANSNLIQFRARRSGAYKKYDLRNILSLFSIANGGGHEGAIAFRIPRGEISDFESYVKELVSGIETALPV